MTKTKYLSEKTLDHTLRGEEYVAPSELYMALFTVLPDSLGEGGVEVEGTGYARLPLRASLGVLSDGFVTNTDVIEFTTTETDWGVIKAFGIYDAPTNGNLLSFKPIKDIDSFTRIFWNVGQLSFAYQMKPVVISDWDSRPKTNVYEGHVIQYGETGTLYTYSSNVKDYVRSEYYDLFIYDTQAELIGNKLPLDPTMDYPWDSIQGDDTAWSIFNDGDHDWARVDTTSDTAIVSLVGKTFTEADTHSYFSQGHIYVPTKNGTDTRGSELVFLSFFPETKRAGYSFSGGTSPHINRISHHVWGVLATATSGGTHFYTSPQTNVAPVWVEIYGVRNPTDVTKFKSLIYINHQKEPMNYYDESMPSGSTDGQDSGVKAMVLGDNSTSASSDTRIRDFKVGALWRKQ